MKLEKTADVFVDEENKKAIIRDELGREFKGHIRIKPVMCGRKCNGCPHKYYKYAVWRDGKKIREKYLGVLKEGGEYARTAVV